MMEKQVLEKDKALWYKIYATDFIHCDEIMVKYCPTDDMIADYNTKPLVGDKFSLIKYTKNICPKISQPHQQD